ncbi:hypothetical protein LshimejAT787_1101070 [Lyophyllum shimeji]|uniref:Uncharacterized protein n=1 Tax=Lyophyllum shimeji TaxID=47721 RepID=A0A9P3PVM3_LYOSH|nr:hypothetical protein LshimejAT787_1101070 [Lyophyllum shimeji]
MVFSVLDPTEHAEPRRNIPLVITLHAAESQYNDHEQYSGADHEPFELDIRSNSRTAGHIAGFKIDPRTARNTGDCHCSVEHFSQISFSSQNS